MSSTTKRTANGTTRVPVPTDLNMFVLAACIAAAPGGILGRVAATHVSHIRRCIDAGLPVRAGPGSSLRPVPTRSTHGTRRGHARRPARPAKRPRARAGRR